MRFGILQRYVMGEVLRSFLMALSTITIVFVLFVVMTEATKMGLSPREILGFIPFVIPTTLPYTVPVSLLFAVTVVYGRLAGDNEVIAVKTAGLSAWTVLRPSLSLGLAVSVVLLVISGGLIPTANTKFRQAMFKGAEDLFYKYLKKDREYIGRELPFVIKVKDVEGQTLIGPTFKHRAPKAPGDRVEAPGGGDADIFDVIIQAKTAEIHFDIEAGVAHVKLDGSNIQQSAQMNSFMINDSEFDIPLADVFKRPVAKRIQEMTDSEMAAMQREYRDLLVKERKRQAFDAALRIGSGRLDTVQWPAFQRAFIDYRFWEQKCYEFETERQMRVAMACGSFFFVLLGGPMGIRFARRDFLSAFITCFVPIIIIYYPLMLGGVNLGKDGLVVPMFALWIGNAVLFLLAALVLRPVLKH